MQRERSTGSSCRMWRQALGAVVAAAILALGCAAAATRAGAEPDFATDLPIPSNAQFGTGDLTINCSVEIGGVPMGTAAVNALTSGVLPTIVRPGQALWVTSVHARTELPVAVTDQLYSLGARKLQVKLLKADLYLRDGAHSSANLAESNRIEIPTITLVPGQPIVVSLGDRTPLKQGPLQTQGPGVAHLALGETETEATVENAQGAPLFTVQTDCPQPNPPQLTATVDVAGKPGSGQVSIPGNYPARYVPADSLVGSTGFQYRCHIGGVGTFSIDGSGTQFGSFGAGGLVFSPGERIYFQDTQGQMTLGAKLVNRLIEVIGGRSPLIRLTLEHAYVTAEHFLPTTANLVPVPVLGTTGRLRGGTALRLRYPQPGTVLKPFYLTAGAPGIGDEWLGDEAFTLQPVTTAGDPLGPPLRASCPTPRPLVPIFPAVVQ
jgi:hypothetical protein